MKKETELKLIQNCIEAANLLHGEMLLSDNEVDRIMKKLETRKEIVLTSK